MKQVEVQIINRLGLHARAAAKVVETAGGFSCDVALAKGEHQVDAKSIMEVMMLAATQGTHVHVRASGADEDAAVEALVALIDDRFGEGE